MKIEDNRSNDKVFFKDLSKGELFYWDDKIFLKIEENEIKTKNPAIISRLINAVRLLDGTCRFFNFDEIVYHINAKLVIE